MYADFVKKQPQSLVGQEAFEYKLSNELSQKFFCRHVNKKHCAKNMCRSCYHQSGNSKNATKCEHTDKPNYAKGKCKNCYFSIYYEKKLKTKRAMTRIQSKQNLIKNK